MSIDENNSFSILTTLSAILSRIPCNENNISISNTSWVSVNNSVVWDNIISNKSSLYHHAS